MSDVLGPGAYGDPANPKQSREEFDAANGVTSATPEAPVPPAPAIPDPAAEDAAADETAIN